jgi:hypothetical protein
LIGFFACLIRRMLLLFVIAAYLYWVKISVNIPTKNSKDIY